MLRIDIYRNDSGDSTLGGVSAPGSYGRYLVFLALPTVEEAQALEDREIAPLYLDPRTPALGPVLRPCTVKVLTSSYAPVNNGLPKGGFGGNFGFSSDSRFTDMLAKLGYARAPVAIHDRFEYAL
jgi:hypothetical protein